MSTNTEELIWSNVDFPYSCLKDIKRTKVFKQTIDKQVKVGDVVVDAGSGSGILALMCASAGAKKVYAVEIDHTLADSLRKTIEANNFENIIEVVEGDILSVNFPKKVDVVVAELMDTGLIDEMQVPVMNNFHNRGVITRKSKIIPKTCNSYIQPAYSNNEYYGYKILIPKHEWPFYDQPNSGWLKSDRRLEGSKELISSVDFSTLVKPEVSKELVFMFDKPTTINSLVLSSDIELVDGIMLGATNALNSDKIIPIDELENINELQVKISYVMGAGFKTLKINCKSV